MRDEETIFAEALRAGSPAERAAFLDRACAADPDLRREVEALLAAHDQAAGFLQSPPISSTQTLPTGDDAVAADARRTSLPHEQAGSVVGPYKLLEQIGEGGMGVVFMAEQVRPVRRRVALKIIKPGMDTRQVIARFDAERQALALMDHPGIAKVLEAGATEAGRPYFVMELVRGVPITEYCDEHRLDPRQRLGLFVQVCQAVQHAHTKGIIHRDLKPTNVLVTVADDGRPVPKVIDFGIAKATAGQRLTDRTLFTEFRQLVGTPLYMSPEQAEMSAVQDVDTRSDVYGLGVLLYELLTGTTPFDKQRLAKAAYDEVRRIIREEEPPRPSTRLSTLGETLTTVSQHRHTDPNRLGQLVRGELDWIVMRCLEKDRGRRYETANGLARDVERYLSDQPVEACPPSRLYRLRKLVRRNRAAIATAATLFIVMLVATLVSTWQARRAHEKEFAERQTAYAGDMNLTQQALAIDNLGRARQLLYRNQPPAGGPDLRGWEWRYLWRQCQGNGLVTLCRKSSEIASVAVSHDGQWAAIGERMGGKLSIWDLAKRREIACPPAGDGIVRVAFSPLKPLLAFTTTTSVATTTTTTATAIQNRRYSVHVWNVEANQMVGEFALPGECSTVQFSRDGETLITFTDGPEGRVILWDLRTGSERVSYPTPQSLNQYASTPCAVAPDMTVAAHEMPTGQLRLLDLRTGAERWRIKAADESLLAIAFSPDGKLLATGGGFAESDIRLWDVAFGTQVGSLEGHRSCVFCLEFDSSGKTLFSAGGDQTIRKWDVADQRLLGTLRGHELEVWRLALLPDNNGLLSGCKDGSVSRWDMASIVPEHHLVILPEHISAWRFAPDSRSVVSLDRRGQVARWDGPGFQTPTVLFETGGGLAGGRFVGTRWVGGLRDGVLQVWDLQLHAPVKELAVSAAPVSSWWGQGDRLFFYCRDRSLHEWDATRRPELRQWHDVPAFSRAAYSSEAHRSLSLDLTGAGTLIDDDTGRMTSVKLDLQQISDLTFSPDGKLFAAASALGYAKVWETATLDEKAAFRGSMLGVHSVAFSPDGSRLAVGGDGREAMKVWDVRSRQELLTLGANVSLFGSSAYSPDGNILGSKTGRGKLHLWPAPSWEEIEAAEASSATSR